MEYFDFQDLDGNECAKAFLDVLNFYNNSFLADWREELSSYTDEEISLFRLIEQGFDRAWEDA